ncbi:ABC transporter permease [Mesorhizobium sp. SP-1A]|uniref:ABC transporter permease n=1 Tax=Mesorhizobium sp. SP-1A TaxID=3077840 RepID=UPI0028F74C5E|nr:ABC transporter permease [Mesorhizobium sp. SP-1A]
MRADTIVKSIAGVLCAVLVLPIVIVVILSFSGDRFLSFPPSSVSLQWYARFFGDDGWRSALFASLAIAAATCVISTVLGFLGAYAFVRGRIPAKQLMLSFVLLPLIVPHIITAIALYFASVPLGLVGVKLWIAVGHSVVAVPIVVLILMSALQGVDINLERAALSLGADRLTVFRRIVLPLVLPALLSAALFSFLASFDELVISLFLSGVASETLPVRIWNSLRMEIEPTIAAVSAFLIGITTIVLLADAAVKRLLARRSTG